MTGSQDAPAAPEHASREHLYVLVSGWPASGKSTLARQLSVALGLAYLAKDEVLGAARAP